MQRGENLSGRSVSNGHHRWFGKLMFIISCAGLFAALAGLAAVMHSGWRVNAAADALTGRAADKVWKVMGETARERQASGNLPPHALLWQLDEAALRRVLEQAPPEGMGALEDSPAILPLPLPDGTVTWFRIVDSPVLAPELVAQYPQIKSYRGQGVENLALAMRCSWTPGGLSVLMTDGAQTVLIQPLAWFRQAPVRRQGASTNQSGPGMEYVSYYGQDYMQSAEAATCLVKGDVPPALKQRQAAHRARAAKAVAESVTLRKYRIAIATTAQYQSGAVGNVSGSIANWVSSVNLILEKELAVTLMVVATVDGSSVSDSATDAALDSVRTLFKTSIADSSTYDVAHLLGIGSGGNAYVGGLCETLTDNTGPYKAAGITLLTASQPVTDSGAIALLHEIGHQLGATHTFGADCGGGRVGDTAFEPGSGATLMSLGGSCSGSNVNTVTMRDKHFHSGSLAQIVAFLDSFGGTCGMAMATSNLTPTVTVGGDVLIPKGTPFTLTGTVSDTAGQALKYTWEQIDAGGSFLTPPYGDQAGDPVETTRPLFHAMAPADPATGGIASRSFSGITPANFQIAESLPSVSRALNFRLTARDGQSSGGGVSGAAIRIEVVGNAGPFQVTSPNTAMTLQGGPQTITWDKNSTDASPINCAMVKITLLTNSGASYYATLAESTPNTGSANVIFPNVALTNVRVKIEAVGNIFYDISDADLTIAVNCSFAELAPASQIYGPTGDSGTVNITAGQGCSWTAVSNAAWITINSGSSGTGTGAPQPVTYSVAANSGTQRTGTMTIAGQTFTVTQQGVAGLQFYPLPSPVRLLDTRSGFSGCVTGTGALAANSTRTQAARTACSTIPANAIVVTGNITVVPSGAGYLTLFPSDAAQPTVANSNFNAGEVTNNFFTVGLGASDGSFKIFSSAATDVIIDVNGYYAPPGTGGMYYHTLPSPVRLVQTYPGQTGCILNGSQQLQGTNNANADPALDLVVQGRGSTLPSPCNSIPSDAAVLVGNATTVLPNAPFGFGYLTIYPSDATRPTAATSNYATNDVINGPFAVKLGADGKFKVYTFSTTHLVIDISGYYSASAMDANGAGLLFNPLPKPMRLLETRNIPGLTLTGCYQPQAPIPSGTGGIRAQQAWGSCSDQSPLAIPNTARALAGNVTVINPVNAGFGTFFPGDVANASAPAVATTNYVFPVTFGYNRHYYVGLSPTDGTFKILTSVTSDYIVDVSGYFAP